MKKKQQTFIEKEIENGKINEAKVISYRLVNKNEINFDKLKKILYDNYKDNSIQLIVASSSIDKVEGADKTLQQIVNEYNDYVIRNYNNYYRQVHLSNPELPIEEVHKLQNMLDKQCKETICHFIVDSTMSNNKVYFVSEYNWTIF